MRSDAPANATGAIREIAHDSADLRKVSAMHMQLLDWGPMAGLGETFVRKACYAMHMRDGTLQCALYEVEGEPAGFVAYTDRSVGFHREGLRKHWMYAGLSLAESLLEDPRRSLALVRALRVVASRRGEADEHSDPLGEIVCLAVKPEYLKPDFIRKRGIHVSEELIRYAGRRLRVRGVTRMRAHTDAFNKAVLFLYHRLGATFAPFVQAGESMIAVWFDLDESFA